MPTPYDLRQLHELRRRGQCPKLAVFVTDSWDWHQRLADIGVLCIRVQRPQDCEHDWSAIRGLDCVLLYRRFGDFSGLGQALLAAGPSRLETFHVDEPQTGPLYSRLVVGKPMPYLAAFRRDTLLNRLLRY